MGTGGDFAYRCAAGVPCNHVTTVGDINSSLVVTAFDFPCLVNRVQLGMERPAEGMKRKFRNFGANRKHKAIP